MARQAGTSRTGSSFSGADVLAVWQKATVVPGYDASEWRKDRCGAFISRLQYGNTQSQHGWEIDHIRPVAKGGDDAHINLQPLQWQNNRTKGDNYPQWSCQVSAA